MRNVAGNAVTFYHQRASRFGAYIDTLLHVCRQPPRDECLAILPVSRHRSPADAPHGLTNGVQLARVRLVSQGTAAYKSTTFN
jgi:hypothetical protein